jgi:signal transduction histidine kinase
MDIFYLKTVLAFIVGAIWITGATIIAERFGSKIGGVITGIPSTIVLTLFFIGWTQTPQVAADTTGIIPAIMGLDALFTAIYILLSKNKLYVSIGVSLLSWFILSFILVVLKLNNFFLSLFIFLLLLIVSYILGEKVVRVKSERQRKIVLTYREVSFRAILSGTIISFAVVMTKLGGPILGGMFASFPAIMLSTMIITYIAHGRNFSVAVMKVIMVSGCINVVVYTTSVRYLYPLFDIYVGTLYAFLISLVCSFFMYQFVNKKMI